MSSCAFLASGMYVWEHDEEEDRETETVAA